ncbi:MAG: right-handed parallel beta-helix repeat-containing protein [Actinomycetota bacterium]|nr:right-handed parallel beta-helix repeat-containing protein [Actinomycetota bacterium]
MRLPGSRRTSPRQMAPRTRACLALLVLLGLQVAGSGASALAVPPQPPGDWNTGIPAGTSLRPSGPLVVTDNATVIDGLDVQGCVQVKAHLVTIRRTRVRCADWFGIRVHEGYRATRVEDVEVDGLGSPSSIGVSGAYLTLRRSNIHGVGDGVRVGSNSLYEGNFIHDLAIGDGSHNDGMQVTGAATNATIRGNTIVHVRRQTSAIIVKADQGPIRDILIEGNWLNGGTYTLYAYSTQQHDTQDVTVRHNRFGRDHVYGAVATKNPQGLRWEGNVWDDTEQPVPPPRSAEDPESQPEPSPLDGEIVLLRELLEMVRWLARRM